MQTDRIQRPNCWRYTLGWGGPKSKEPHLPEPENRRPTDLPTTIPPLGHWTDNSVRICPRTRSFPYTTPQHHLWPFPPLHLQTKAERKIGKFPLSPQSPRRKVPSRVCRRRSHKRHLYSLHDKHGHPTRIILLLHYYYYYYFYYYCD